MSDETPQPRKSLVEIERIIRVVSHRIGAPKISSETRELIS
jgi:hypothetical protein